MTRGTKLFCCALAAAALATCDDRPTSASTTVLQSPARAPIRVLMLTATAGFRHDAIDMAKQAMSTLASSSGEMTVTSTEDLSTLNQAGLGSYWVGKDALRELTSAAEAGRLSVAAKRRA